MAADIFSASPARRLQETASVFCTATGTNGENCVITGSNGAIDSIDRTNEGEYTVTFNTWGPVVAGYTAEVRGVSAATPRMAQFRSFDLTAGTAVLETWIATTVGALDIAVAPALGDVVENELLYISVTFREQ